MKCQNCGARLGENETVCPNCGAFTDENSGYTIITTDDTVEDIYSSRGKKPRKGLKLFLIILLVIAIAGAGSYAYFTLLLPKQNSRPELTFTTGAGVINETEKVVYITMDKGNNVEYIHGVRLYDETTEGEPLSTDYEYTKNVDDSFRTIFFYVDDFGLKEGTEYSYIFTVTVSFNGSDTRYDYEQTVDFNGTITENASAAVFDHSMYERSDNENATETTAEATTQAATQAAEKIDTAFVYEGFWYGVPVENGDRKAVDAYEFSESSYKVTHYTKDGDEDWRTATESGDLKEENNALTLTGDSGTLTVTVGSDKTLKLENAGVASGELVARKYNSTVNANDMFEEE